MRYLYKGLKLPKSINEDLKRIELAYQVEKDNPHLTFFEVNRLVKKLMQDNIEYLA